MKKSAINVCILGFGDPDSPAVALGMLKTYLDSSSSLKGGIKTVFLEKVEDLPGLKRDVLESRPDVIIFSLHEDRDNLKNIRFVAGIKRELGGKPVTIISSENPRNSAETRTINDSGVDFVVSGEYERPVEQLLNHILNGTPSLSSINGLTYIRAAGTAV